MSVTTSPRIYVASLADYNAGRLIGCWIDADQDEEEIWTEIRAMLARSKEPIAEEWAIHDYEGFGDLHLHEFSSIERVAKIGQAIGEHGGAMAAFLSLDSERDPDDFYESYIGEYASAEDYAYQYVADVGWGGMERIPEELESYLDWDKITLDLFDHGDYTAVKTPEFNVWVFRDDW